MRKIFKILIAALSAAALVCFAACGNDESGSVRLVNVSVAEVGTRSDIDYFVIAEPAASTRVSALPQLTFSGDLQLLYGGESGYPQAVVVAKNELVEHVAEELSSKLKKGSAWLLSEEAAAEKIVSAVGAHISQGATPALNEKNLTKEVIKNCSVNFVDAWDCKQEVQEFMRLINGVGESSFGVPQDGFFIENVMHGGKWYNGKITVYTPDGAPALGLAELMCNGGLSNCAETEYNVVDSSIIHTFVTGNSPAADVCVLPVNMAVKLLGGGERYKLLGTLTHGNLYLVSNGKNTVTPRNISQLTGKTVGVVNLPQVPGLTFKTILNKYGIAFTEAG